MKARIFFTILGILLVLALAAGTAVFLIANKPKAARQKPIEASVLVEVQAVKARDVAMRVEAHGNVKARETLKLVAEVSGRITALAPVFEEGNPVAAGTTIIQIDPRSYALEVEHQKSQIQMILAEIKQLDQQVRNLHASIEIAKNDVALAQAEVKRMQYLMGKNVVAQTTLDKTEQRYLASREQLQRLQNELALTGSSRLRLQAQEHMSRVLLKQAQLNLEKTTIKMPYYGWVAEKQIELGQQVHAGEYLGRVYRDGRYDVEISITAEDMVWLVDGGGGDTGWMAEVESNDGGKTRIWQGRVVRSKAEVETATRTQMFVVQIEAPLKNPSVAADTRHQARRLKPGLFVTVKILGRLVQNLFVLPRHVVYDGDVVYTMADERLKFKTVSVLRYYSEKAFIDGGLETGDLVVITPLSNPLEGMRLRVGTN